MCFTCWVDIQYSELTSREKVEAVGVNSEAGHCVQVCHHRVYHLACRIVKEPDVSVFMSSHRQWQRRVTNDPVDLAPQQTIL